MLSTEIRYQKGVGPKLAAVFSNVGVETLDDLIHYFPREYEDRSSPTPISQLKFGEEALIKVSLVKLSSQRTKRNFSIVKGLVRDASGQVNVIWFNQPFLIRVLKEGTGLFIAGKLERNDYSGDTVFVPRDYDVITETSLKEPIVPRYPLTEGLAQKTVRRIIRNALQSNMDKIEDPLPAEIKEKFKLQDLKRSIIDLHFPKEMSAISPARHRLAFDELLVFQLGLIQNRKNIDENTGITFNIDGDMTRSFKDLLPFKFTGAQTKVMGEILSDMSSKKVMNRLLQGDVGSGKTVVALYAMVAAVQSGYQAAIMAPTEILARQHFDKISKMVEGLGIEVLILTGSERAKRKETLAKLEAGGPLIIIGTHALIEKDIKFGKLGLVVIDEQHRFGVKQRLELRKKGDKLDLLVMTATPIPRTLALTLYGDLDRSVIDEMPPNRTKIITRYVKDADRQKLNLFIREQLSRGRQAYVVCPLIEESEKIDLKAAEEEAKIMQKTFPEFKVELLHGRMKAADKDSVMKDFVAKKVNILVSTTVIEVGIDVPNATLMVIEHAQRFGLSQLHQLRGRIGRGSEQSYCFLAGNALGGAAKSRIDAMLKTTDGFKIAEADLKLRGPGEFFGSSQWGLPNFRVADIITDEEIILEAREAAVLLLQKCYDLKAFNIKSWGSKLE